MPERGRGTVAERSRGTVAERSRGPLILFLLLFLILRKSRKRNRSRITMSVLRPPISLLSYYPTIPFHLFHSKKFQKEKQKQKHNECLASPYHPTILQSPFICFILKNSRKRNRSRNRMSVLQTLLSYYPIILQSYYHTILLTAIPPSHAPESHP